MLKVLNGEQEKWPYSLDRILFPFCTVCHKSTGISPFEIIYGRIPVLPLHCIENNKYKPIINEVPVDLDTEEGIYFI